MGRSNDLETVGNALVSRRAKLWWVVAITLFVGGVVARHLLRQSTRAEILRLAQSHERGSVWKAASLAESNPDVWSRDMEIVEAIAALAEDQPSGWQAERALRHAQVGGIQWRRVVVRTLSNDFLTFDNLAVISAVGTVARQARSLHGDVLMALAQRLRWACQDRDCDLPGLVQRIAGLLEAHPAADLEFRRSLRPIEIDWLEASLSRSK